MEAFFLFLIILVIFIAIFSICIYIFSAIGISTMAKRRGIENSWFAFIPLVSNFTLGSIVDNINAYQQKNSNYKLILLVLGVLVSIFGGVTENYARSTSHEAILIIASMLAIVFRIFMLISLYNIYKDYSYGNEVLFTILSAIFVMDFIFIFALRKKVPVSMCFSPDEQWQFKENQATLQVLWTQFHSYNPPLMSFGEFLMMNFVPIQYSYNTNQQGHF